MRKIMPPTYFMVLLALAFMVHFFFPIMKISIRPYNYPGWILIAFGIIINLWADSLMKQKQTTVKPHQNPSIFISSGPFRLSRHPMYLGMLSILLGTALLLGSLAPFIFPAAFIILMETLFIPTEENNMKKNFGKEYLDYKAKVRRWV
ncbi:isoprenylcysteine carboxylmethyltransferase family protein [Candidatus Woesearchaeota archaeon]|nr:isoprenylcysteine carboxylmethyltransferase family protein [Candidatus Woesearchaeota archaeon]